MPDDEEMIKAIRKKLRSGYPEGELKNELLEKGHMAEDIERWFFVASGHADKPSEAKTRLNSNTSMFYLSGVALLITGITIMSAETWLKEYGPYLLVASGVCFVIGVIKGATGKPK